MTLVQPPAAPLEWLCDPARSGVFRCDEARTRTLADAAPAAGCKVYRVDLSQVHDVVTLHPALARALHFPTWYGANWDALADCLADLPGSEAGACLLILRHAEVLQTSSPEAFAMLLDVLQDTVLAWRAQQTAFSAIVSGLTPQALRPGASA